jgi:hypothetical protein
MFIHGSAAVFVHERTQVIKTTSARVKIRSRSLLWPRCLWAATVMTPDEATFGPSERVDGLLAGAPAEQ